MPNVQDLVMETAIDIGGRLRALRNSHGLSQRALAERSGVSNAIICLIEQNRTNPSVGLLRRIVEAIPIALGDFFSSENAVTVKEVEGIQKQKFGGMRRNVGEAIADHLQELVLERLKPGEKLPPERELMKMFQVSRSSIRDAIRRLHLMGLVRPRQGIGTIVCDISEHALLGPITSVLERNRKSVVELMYVRKLIEPSLAALAARNATREHISELQEILSQAEKTVRLRQVPDEEDKRFHHLIALAAQNSVLLKVVEVLMELLSRERSLHATAYPMKACRGHRRILDAIKQGDAAAAGAAMQAHLEDIAEFVEKQPQKS
jgi:GntR family transcriptional repressor for pyruvate dehydrogenase complex